MISTQYIENLKNKISGKISLQENLSKHSWFNLGGPAKVLFRPKNLKELSFFLKEINKKSKIKVLGAGSNTLIRDGGLDGIIIKLGPSFSRISLFDPTTLIAGASALDKKVSNFALKNSVRPIFLDFLNAETTLKLSGSYQIFSPAILPNVYR